MSTTMIELLAIEKKINIMKLIHVHWIEILKTPNAFPVKNEMYIIHTNLREI